MITGLLIDNRGLPWEPALDYQDRDTDAPGWLMLQCRPTQEKATFARVVGTYGFRDRGEPYLMVRPFGSPE